MKGKGEVSQTMLNEKKASQLPYNEFKELVIRNFMSSHTITKNYRENTMNSLQIIST